MPHKSLFKIQIFVIILQNEEFDFITAEFFKLLKLKNKNEKKKKTKAYLKYKRDFL
jgi:hypothetical protein